MVVVGSADSKMKTEVKESELAEGAAVPTLAAAVGHRRRVSLTSVGRHHQGLLSSCLMRASNRDLQPPPPVSELRQGRKSRACGRDRRSMEKMLCSTSNPPCLLLQEQDAMEGTVALLVP